jgi:hypothetical protein
VTRVAAAAAGDSDVDAAHAAASRCHGFLKPASHRRLDHLQKPFRLHNLTHPKNNTMVYSQPLCPQQAQGVTYNQQWWRQADYALFGLILKGGAAWGRFYLSKARSRDSRRLPQQQSI